MSFPLNGNMDAARMRPKKNPWKGLALEGTFSGSVSGCPSIYMKNNNKK